MKTKRKDETNSIDTTSTNLVDGYFQGQIQKVLGYGYMTADSSIYNSIKDFRKTLKKNPTEAEKVMWGYLRNKKTGFRIRRQHIIDIYIPDFVCLTKKVVIEIDGKIHLRNKKKDEIRSNRLIDLGYEILRFTNEEVLENPKLVFYKIKNFLENKEEIIKDQKGEEKKGTKPPQTPPEEGLKKTN